MRIITHLNRSFVLMSGLFLALVACSDHRNPLATPDIALSTTSLGTVLTGQDGRTLYFFANDADGNSSCTGQCSTVWPTFYKENPTLGTNLNAADFGVITRADGSRQTTYKGWPLYYFRNDARAGDVNGENVGNVWFVAKPNYTVLVANAQLVGNDGRNYINGGLVEGTGRTMYFVDGRGRTLYIFAARDTNRKNNYTREDFSNNATWPLFEESPVEVPSSLDRTLFSIITVAGRQQLTYKGWPLYYFGGDNQQRGSTKGVSVPRPGVWPVATATLPSAP